MKTLTGPYFHTFSSILHKNGNNKIAAATKCLQKIKRGLSPKLENSSHADFSRPFYFFSCEAVIKRKLPLESVKIKCMCALRRKTSIFHLLKATRVRPKERRSDVLIMKESNTQWSLDAQAFILKVYLSGCRCRFEFAACCLPIALLSGLLASASFEAPLPHHGNRCVWGAVIDWEPEPVCASIHAIGLIIYLFFLNVI